MFIAAATEKEIAMVHDPVNILLTLIGIFVWPEMTLCVILWCLGHPILGVLALIVGSGSTTIRTKTIT